MAHTYRVNTPGPSYTIQARSLHDAMLQIGMSLEGSTVMRRGYTIDVETQERDNGQQIGYVSVLNTKGRKTTGCCVYREEV